LAKKPDDRVQSMGRLKVMLRRAVGEEVTDAEMLDSLSRRGPAWWRWPAIASGFVLTIAIVIAVLFAMGKHSAGKKVTATRSWSDLSSATRNLPDRPHRIVINVSSQPPGAMVFRESDGLFIGRTPLQLKGKQVAEHAGVLIFRLEGHQEHRAHLKPAESGSLRVRLEPLPLEDKNLPQRDRRPENTGSSSISWSLDDPSDAPPTPDFDRPSARSRPPWPKGNLAQRGGRLDSM
jgi:hypothetical protein